MHFLAAQLRPVYLSQFVITFCNDRSVLKALIDVQADPKYANLTKQERLRSIEHCIHRIGKSRDER